MSYQILSKKDGRPIMKDGDPVRAMDYTVEKIEQLDDANKTFIAVASTEHEDRDKDIIRQDGWDLKNYKKNPMIPWSHDYWGIPIGKSLRTWVDKVAKKLMFKPQFDSQDDDSMKIFNKFKNGFLTSFSVGFRGIKSEPRDEEDRWWGGIEFLQQELLEISAVTIPANPNATVSLHGVDAAGQNLLQMGYPQKFAQTEHGLFYPIRELGEYIDPQVISHNDIEGIQAVHACSIDSESSEDTERVGYFFSDSWEPSEVISWIKENNTPTYKAWFYNFKWSDGSDDEEKTWSVKREDEDRPIPDYDADPVEATITLTDADKKDDGDDVIPEENNKVDVSDLLIKQISEIVQLSVTEAMVKLSDAFAKSFDEIFDKILTDLNDIKASLVEKEAPETDDGEQFEIDDSLLSPNDKSNSDEDSIEIDDDAIDQTKLADTVLSVFQTKLKEAFTTEIENQTDS